MARPTPWQKHRGGRVGALKADAGQGHWGSLQGGSGAPVAMADRISRVAMADRVSRVAMVDREPRVAMADREPEWQKYNCRVNYPFNYSRLHV